MHPSQAQVNEKSPVIKSDYLFEGCERCGGGTVKRNVPSENIASLLIDICLECGHEKYHYKEQPASWTSQEQFGELRRQRFQKGIRKYRHNPAQAFQGNPFVGASRTLANAANFVEVVSWLFPEAKATCDLMNKELFVLYERVEKLQEAVISGDDTK